MIICNPDSNLKESRDKLLQQCLRPDSMDSYPICLEYPLLLDISSKKHSYCVVNETDPKTLKKKVVAHANLVPRVLTNSATNPIFHIGVIGNVATDPEFRHQGIMRRLFTYLEEQAVKNGLNALILWSHQLEFYHTLGFIPVGHETRYFFRKAQKIPEEFGISSHYNREFLEQDYRTIMSMRPNPGLFLLRKPSEFLSYLKIPDTYLLTLETAQGLQGYCIIGKGRDLINVIHEWGCLKPEYLSYLISHILIETQWPEVCLLCPNNIGLNFTKYFNDNSDRCEVFTGALGRYLGEQSSGDFLDSAFYWGFDSI